MKTSVIILESQATLGTTTKPVPPGKDNAERENPGLLSGATDFSVHSFEYQNRFFAFDPSTCSYFEINPLTHEVIQALLLAKNNGSREKELDALRKTHGEEDVMGVLLDLETLRDAGYFFKDEPETQEEVDNYIDALVPQVSSSIKLDISEACNLGCRYCYAEGGSFGHEPMMMSKEVAKKAIDMIFERSVRVGSDHVGIIFLGGEPLVNLEVMKFAIDYSQILGKEQGKDVGYSMTTNATLFSDEALELITEYRIGIKVSIDGEKDIHDYLRPYKDGGGTFDDVIANIRKLVAKRGYPPAVRAVITNKNLNLNGIAEYLEEIGFNLIGFGYAEGSCFKKGTLDLRPKDWKVLEEEERQVGLKVLEKLDSGETPKFNPYDRLLVKIHHRTKTKMRCGYARGTITVAADGKIFPCPLSPGKRDPYVIGDVWQGVDMKRVKAMVADYYKVKKYCYKTCWAKHICGGPCPTYVAHDSGRHLAPDEVECEFVRKGFEFGIWLYQELKERHPQYLEEMVETPS